MVAEESYPLSGIRNGRSRQVVADVPMPMAFGLGGVYSLPFTGRYWMRPTPSRSPAGRIYPEGS